MRPERKTLLAICRVSNLPTVWMNVIAAAVLAHGDPPVAAVLLLIVGFSAFYSGGMVLNDYFDREYDARDQPFRPIPSGRIRKEQARRLAVGLLCVGMGALSVTPVPTALIPGFGLAVAIYVYDRWHKEFAASVLLMAATRTLVFVTTSWALVDAIPGTVWVAGAASFLWTLLVTIVARYENQRGERYAFPVIPWMIAGMAALDGLILAFFIRPGWLVVGLALMGLTRFGQRWVRGD